MTLSEYEIRLEAFQLARVEKEHMLAKQAWYNQIVQNVDDSGKPQFSHFEQFFNLQEQIDAVRGEFEPDYKAQKKVKKSEQDILLERIKEYQKKHPRKAVNDG